jgi:hypothetical protein
VLKFDAGSTYDSTGSDACFVGPLPDYAPKSKQDYIAIAKSAIALLSSTLSISLIEQRSPLVFFLMNAAAARVEFGLTDEMFRLREQVQLGNLPQEVEARRRLVETAWQLNLPTRLIMGVDDNGETLTTNYSGRRVTVTRSRDALNGWRRSARGTCRSCNGVLTSSEFSNEKSLEEY